MGRYSGVRGELRGKEEGRPTDKVAILKVEPIQLIARGLRIHNIFVDDKCGALGVVCDALADLAVIQS